MREGGMLNGREPQWDEVPDPHDPDPHDPV